MTSLQIKLKDNYIHFSEFFLGVYYLWFFLPFMRTTFTGIYKYLFFGFFLVGLALLVWKNINAYGMTIRINNTIIVPILAYMAFMAFLCLFDIHDALDHIRVSFTFWGTALAYYLMGVIPDGRRRFAQFLLFITVFTIITSTVVIWNDPSASRELTNSATTKEDLARDYYLGRKNVSSIYLFQGIATFSPIFVGLIKKKHIWFGLLGLVFSFAILLKASFLIALGVMVLGVMLSLVQNEKKNPIPYLIASVMALIAFILPWSDIFAYLANAINDSYISVRLNELSLLFDVGNVTGDTAGRLDAYTHSISTLLQHPLGVGPYYFSREAREYIGKHSQILDDLARYGIAAFAFYCVFLKRYYALLEEKWRRIGMGGIAGPIIIAYIALLLLNIGFRSAEESAIMLFILPELPEIILYQKDKRRLSEDYVG